MNGLDAIAADSIGDEMDDFAIYQPVSRIMAGGFSNGRPVEVAVLGVDLIDDEDPYNFIVSDNDEIFAVEA